MGGGGKMPGMNVKHALDRANRVVVVLAALALGGCASGHPEHGSVTRGPDGTLAVRCPVGAAPTVDGRVERGEWDDALVLQRADEPWAYDAMADRRDVRYGRDDLSAQIRMKHAGQRLYLLAVVRDDRVYGVDTPMWPPTAASDRPEPYWDTPGDSQDWGWWGDSVEVGICANMAGDYDTLPYTGPVDAAKPGECWKIQGNVSYDRLMAGALEPWAEAGHLRCAIRRTESGYVQEWSVALTPCLATGDGKHYRPGQSAPMGLQLMVLDLDRREDGAGHWSNIHHQAVWSYTGRAGKKQRPNWAKLVLLPAGGD